MQTLIADIKYHKALDGLFVSSVVISLLDSRHKCFSILLDGKSPEFLFRLHPQRVPYEPKKHVASSHSNSDKLGEGEEPASPPKAQFRDSLNMVQRRSFENFITQKCMNLLSTVSLPRPHSIFMN